MKLITLLTVLSLMIVPAAIAQTVYSWVDDDGILHISDTPDRPANKRNRLFYQTPKQVLPILFLHQQNH